MEERQTSPSVEPAETPEAVGEQLRDDFDSYHARKHGLPEPDESKSETPTDEAENAAEESATSEEAKIPTEDESVTDTDDESSPAEEESEKTDGSASEKVETVEERRARLVDEFGQDFVDQFANEHAQQMVGKQGAELGDMRTALDKANGQTVEGLLKTDPERVRQLLEEYDQASTAASDDDVATMSVRPRDLIKEVTRPLIKEVLGEMARKSQYDREMAAKYSGEESLDALAKTRETYKAAYLRGDVSLDEILHKAVIADGLKAKALRAVKNDKPDKPQVTTGAPGAGGSGVPGRTPGPDKSKPGVPTDVERFDKYHASRADGPPILDQVMDPFE